MYHLSNSLSVWCAYSLKIFITELEGGAAAPMAPI